MTEEARARICRARRARNLQRRVGGGFPVTEWRVTYQFGEKSDPHTHEFPLPDGESCDEIIASLRSARQGRWNFRKQYRELSEWRDALSSGSLPRTAEPGFIEQRPRSHTPTCEWWHCGWFVCAADPVKGTIYVGAAFPMTIDQASIAGICLRRASDWLREALAERGKANARK
jgi:hypothetical protein